MALTIDIIDFLIAVSKMDSNNIEEIKEVAKQLKTEIYNEDIFVIPALEIAEETVELDPNADYGAIASEIMDNYAGDLYYKMQAIRDEKIGE